MRQLINGIGGEVVLPQLVNKLSQTSDVPGIRGVRGLWFRKSGVWKEIEGGVVEW